MSDNFCATFLAHSSEVRGFIGMLFTLFYTIKCNFPPFVLVIFGVICAAGVIATLTHLKSSNIFFTIAKILLALILTALVVVSLIALFGDFSARIKSQDSALGGAFFALAMQDIPFYTRILVMIGIVSIALFFATRYILGRQVEIHGDFWEHQNLAKRKVWWLNALFFVMLVLICVCAFSLFQMIFLGFEVDFVGDEMIDDVKMTNNLLELSGSNMRFVPDFVADYNHRQFIANRQIALKYSLTLSAIFAITIWLSYFFKNIAMRNGGIDKLADSLNADEIFGDSSRNQVSHIVRGILNGDDMDLESGFSKIRANGTDKTAFFEAQSKKEKMLFGVVEEMAIASNMPMPRVFIMRNESGVNAMCSGERFGFADEQIAIFVTQGALEHFSRDELQGVIAHEFSHAFHGDVALNLKIFSLIFGLTFIMMIGEFFLRMAMQSSRSRSGGKNKGGGVIILALIALVFYMLGFLGQIFAQIIQSAISRQKEFLADASSVQYTRNIAGIKSALKRIRDLQSSAKGARSLGIKKGNAGAIKNISAKPCAHMFFLNSISGFWSKIFATHPSLEARIKALDKIG